MQTGDPNALIDSIILLCCCFAAEGAWKASAEKTGCPSSSDLLLLLPSSKQSLQAAMKALGQKTSHLTRASNSARLLSSRSHSSSRPGA